MKIKNKSTRKVRKVRKVRKHRKGKRPRKSTKSRKMRGGGVVFQQQGLQVALIDLNDITEITSFAQKLYTEGYTHNSVNAMHIAKQIVGQEQSADEHNVFFIVNGSPVGFIQFVIDDEQDIEIKYLGCWYSKTHGVEIYPERSPGQVMMAMFNIYLKQLNFIGHLIYLQSVEEAINYYKTCGFTSYQENENSYVKTKHGNGGTLDFEYPDEVLYSYVSAKNTIDDILRSYQIKSARTTYRDFQSGDDMD